MLVEVECDGIRLLSHPGDFPVAPFQRGMLLACDCVHSGFPPIYEVINFRRCEMERHLISDPFSYT